MNLDWHADRSDLPELATLDQLAVEEPIDLAAVRSHRLGRVRELSSGPRTNPWFQETGDRRLAENELVALDTDVVGCHGWTIPERFVANRYYLSAHGCGMTGEYPYLYHEMDFEESGYDGVLDAGMTLCVESYIGEQGGDEGVKLEQQLLITENGPELLSSLPFEAALLGRPA